MKVEIGTEAAQFHLWEYINGIYISVYGQLAGAAVKAKFKILQIRSFPLNNITKIIQMIIILGTR
jgi:hypothetical protein